MCQLVPPIENPCRVVAVSPLTRSTFLIELEARDTPKYRPGQYLQLSVEVDGQTHTLFYSIANRPDTRNPNRLELIIQCGSDFSRALLERLNELCLNGRPLPVTLPLGQAFLQTDLKQPHLLVASGSGISKIRCIAAEILSRYPEADVRVYWSNRGSEDFYLLEEFSRWQQDHRNFRFTPVLESPAAHWSGRTGYLSDVIKADHVSLHQTYGYLCGSPQMVYGTLDQLAELGLQEDQCYSDVFEFSPRVEEESVAV